MADWLLIDQGNTRLKWLFTRGGRIRSETAGQGDFDMFSQAVSGAAPAKVLFSSVAGPDAAEQLMAFSQAAWGLRAKRLESRAEQGGVRNAYAEPGTLGADRWLAIVGAVDRYGKPLLIWDLGTATTLDAVDEQGNHLGGMILPGPETMLRSLSRDTKLNVPGSLGSAAMQAGKNTADAIRNGVLTAQIGALRQFLTNIAPRLAGEPRLVITGGATESVIPSLEFEFQHDPWLVFRGMLVE